MQVDCEVLAELCRDLSITKFPSFALFKLGGGFELFYGKDNVEDVVQVNLVSDWLTQLNTNL